MKARFVTVTFFALIGIGLLRAPTTFAQSPTEEPTKRPYTFPTPIFIPTYPNDTPQPPTTRVVPTATLNASPATEQPSSDQTYTVQPGDSLWIIAQKMYGNGAKYSLIAEANNITTTTRLRTGTILKIPSAPGFAAKTPTSAPAVATPVGTLAPIISPTATPPSPTPSPTPGSFIPASVAGPLSTAIKMLSAILVLASLITAILAYLGYARAKRLNRITEGKPPLRLR